MQRILTRQREELKKICVFSAFAVNEKNANYKLKEPEAIFRKLKGEVITDVKNAFTEAKLVSKETAMNSKGVVIVARVFVARENGYYLYGKDVLFKKKKYWMQYNNETGITNKWAQGKDFIPDMKFGYTVYPEGRTEVLTDAEYLKVMYFVI